MAGGLLLLLLPLDNYYKINKSQQYGKSISMLILNLIIISRRKYHKHTHIILAFAAYNKSDNKLLPTFVFSKI